MRFQPAIRALVRAALLVLVPLATGWFGFALSFSDRAPGESILERSALILGTQMCGGAIVGFLLPRHWYLSVAAAWGSLFWVALRPTAVLETPALRFPNDQIHPPWVPLGALLLAIALGYAASRVRRQQTRTVPMKARHAGTFELLAFGAAQATALLVLASQAVTVAALLWAVALPLAAWLYAHWRAREHICAIAGAACGLAAFPVSHGLFSLIVLPFPLQLIGVLGLVGETLHRFPGNLAATLVNLERQGETSIAVMLVDYLLNGLVWAAIYGLIGSYVDRRRNGPQVASP